jgi:hypothetical protein
MKKTLFIVLIVATGFLTFSRCSKKAQYESLVKAGLKSGQRHDTLFLGLSLGMTSENFYKKCWELNQEGIVRQGENNASVLYVMEEDLKGPTDVNFYPTFYDDKIYEMPVKFRYKAWTPWDKRHSGDSLQLELLQLFKAWYGDDFMEVTHPERGKAFVKIDGNRRISLYRDRSADGTVWALYTDMTVEGKVKELIKENK